MCSILPVISYSGLPRGTGALLRTLRASFALQSNRWGNAFLCCMLRAVGPFSPVFCLQYIVSFLLEFCEST